MKNTTLVKLTEIATGKEEIHRLTQGHFMAVNYKLPNISVFSSSLCMAYLATHPEALKMKGNELYDATTSYFMEWVYDEIPEDDESAGEQDETAPFC